MLPSSEGCGARVLGRPLESVEHVPLEDLEAMLDDDLRAALVRQNRRQHATDVPWDCSLLSGAGRACAGYLLQATGRQFSLTAATVSSPISAG